MSVCLFFYINFVAGVLIQNVFSVLLALEDPAQVTVIILL